MERSGVSLRDIIGEYVSVLGEKNDQIVLVNADLSGTCRNKQFVKEFPERSFNVGIAEQNMVSFAAGLAHEGFMPYVFTMAPFLSMRACEQCRTDVAYANVPVRLIGTYAGVSGGISGATHWGQEDCAIMCSFPNMVVVEPCDANEAKRLLDLTVTSKSPIYVRSGVNLYPAIYDGNEEFIIGKAKKIVDGDSGTFVCSGVMVHEALLAASSIKEKYGYDVAVIDMHTIKPIDREAIKEAAKTKNVIVAQDHNIIGGLGQIVASVLCEEGLAVNFENKGIPDVFETMAHADYLYKKFGLDAESLAQSMIDLIKKQQWKK